MNWNFGAPNLPNPNLLNYSLLFHIRREALDVLDDTGALDGLHLREHRLGALGRAAAQMALAAFSAHKFARARQAKTFGSRLVGLEL